jgi:hypothetical protein
VNASKRNTKVIPQQNKAMDYGVSVGLAWSGNTIIRLAKSWGFWGWCKQESLYGLCPSLEIRNNWRTQTHRFENWMWSNDWGENFLIYPTYWVSPSHHPRTETGSVSKKVVVSKLFRIPYSQWFWAPVLLSTLLPAQLSLMNRPAGTGVCNYGFEDVKSIKCCKFIMRT